MRAIDTNVIVRYLTGDHPKQSAQARALIEGETVFVGMTVLLETEWVLRSVYGYSKIDVAKTLRDFAGLSNVRIEEPGAAAQALTWAEAGLDFADALHLTRATGCEAFLSFDQRFTRRASKLGTVKVGIP